MWSLAATRCFTRQHFLSARSLPASHDAGLHRQSKQRSMSALHGFGLWRAVSLLQVQILNECSASHAHGHRTGRSGRIGVLVHALMPSVNHMPFPVCVSALMPGMLRVFPVTRSETGCVPTLVGLRKSVATGTLPAARSEAGCAPVRTM